MNILKRTILIFEVSNRTYSYFGGLEEATGPKGMVITAKKLYSHCETRMENSGNHPNAVDAEVLEIYLALTGYDKMDEPVILTWVNPPQRGEKEK